MTSMHEYELEKVTTALFIDEELTTVSFVWCHIRFSDIVAV